MGVPLGELRAHSKRFYLITQKHFDIKIKKIYQFRKYLEEVGFALDKKIL